MAATEKKGRVSFEELAATISRLRAPDGCPWDRAQTFDSLKPCMINEMTEAIAGIDLYHATGKGDNLCEELGDVLLQVLLLSEIAGEMGLFTIDDVIAGLNEKMIRRHPHVFGNASVPDAENVLVKWEEIKKKREKERTLAKKHGRTRLSFPPPNR